MQRPVMWKSLCLLIVVFSFALSKYFTFRQWKHVKATTSPPEIFKNEITDEEFLSAKDYKLTKMRFAFVESLFDLATTIVSLYLLGPMWNLVSCGGEIIHTLLFSLVDSVISTVLSLPFSYYSTFVIEERFGFNKTTKKLFISDTIKQFLVGVVLSSILFPILILVFRWAGDKIVLYGMVLLFVFTIVMQVVYPALIMPLFTKRSPIPEGEHRDAILKLAQECDYPLDHVYITDDSKRSSHQGAFMYGVFKHSVCFSDTVKETFTPNEVAAIVGHEIGHSKHRHIIKQLCISQIPIALYLNIFYYVMKTPSFFYEFGVKDSPLPIIIGIQLTGMISTPISNMLMFPLNYLSRYFEYQADAFAASRKLQLSSSLLKIHKENKIIIEDEPLYSAYVSSHPTVTQRITRINEIQKKLE